MTRSSMQTKVAGRPASRAVPRAMRVKSEGIGRTGVFPRRACPEDRSRDGAFPWAGRDRRATLVSSDTPQARRGSAGDEVDAVGQVEETEREDGPARPAAEGDVVHALEDPARERRSGDREPDHHRARPGIHPAALERDDRAEIDD